MIEVMTEILIKRPLDEVFGFISNFENNRQWQSGMQEAKFISQPPLRVGSTYSQVANFLGREINSTFEVIEYEPGYIVKATSTSGSFPITFTRTVEPVDNRILVHAKIQGEAKGFFKISSPILKTLVKKSIESDCRNLKQILESQ